MKTDAKSVPGGKSSKNNAGKKDGNEKKPFDKKKYRLLKYSNKYKINQWEERRKKAILRNYYKNIDKDQKQNPKQPFKNDSQNEDGKQTQPKKMNAFRKAKQEFYRKKDEKKQRKEEASRVKSETEEALRQYKKKRMQNYKSLSKKTKRGQPVMKDRLEMLLDKIQQQVSE